MRPRTKRQLGLQRWVVRLDPRDLKLQRVSSFSDYQFMTLLREIQDAATNQNVNIATVLRKAKILAARLQNPEFIDWVDRELNGYPEPKTVPEYRIVPALVRGNLSDGYRQFSNAPIMTSFLPPELEGWGGPVPLTGSISKYAFMIEDNANGELHYPWPQEVAVKFGSGGYNPRMQCLGAWLVVSKGSVVAMIETVRNRVLDFVLGIEAAAPEAGEGAIGDSPVPQEKVSQMFNTYVMGGVNNIAAGGSNITQSNSNGVAAGDLASLLSFLRVNGISEKDAHELKRRVESAADPKVAAEGWLGKFAIGAGTSATGAIVGIAAKAIAKYFGLPLP
jgi:hypothetical protein